MGSVGLSSSSQRFLVIGAGQRGHAYARAVTVSTAGTIAAVVDIDSYKRQEFGKKYIWGSEQPQSGQSWASYQEWIQYEIARREQQSKLDADTHAITGVFICTLDETHAEIICALAQLNLHILCEKPLALSLSDCISISDALSKHPSKVVSIGHVLRYSPHNKLLHSLLLSEQSIGEIISIEHTEPVGWWHFAHSYVRGNWRRSTSEGVGSLLTKSCHDIDFLMWLLCSPSALTGSEPHLPSTVSSTGAINHFRPARKPAKAGPATNCLSCPAEPNCIYSAKTIYRDRWLLKERDTGWPVNIVVPEIEDFVSSSGWDAADEKLLEKLGEDYDSGTTEDEQIARRAWYGRCVYESDNDVMDDQTVTVSWDDDGAMGRGPKQALFHMTYPTQAQCMRRGRVYGSLGEITYDSKTITVHTFADNQTTVHQIPKQPPEVEKAHGGGDWGLAGAFVHAVDAVEGGSMSVDEAQKTFVGCDLEEIIRSHAVVFAAEEARRERKVVHWQEWWEGKSSVTTKPITKE